MKNVMVLAALAALACGDKKDAAGGGGGGPATGDPKAGVVAANAAVPAELKDKLSFEEGKGEDGDSAIVLPKGWKDGFIKGHFEPPDDLDLGFQTDYSVGTNCDGSCQPKDWKATADKVNFAQFKDGYEIVKDEQQPNSRVMVAKKDDKVYVTAAWWKDGASRYHTCRAALDGPISKAVEAFEIACRSTKIINW